MKIFFLIILLPLFSLSFVNVHDMTYSSDWIDLKEFKSTTRSYKNSYDGVFGKNWCSILDFSKNCSFHKNKIKKDKDGNSTIYVDNVVFIFKFENDRVKSITNLRNESYNIFYNHDGLVSSITNSSDPKRNITFSYQNKLLVEVVNEWGSRMLYQYNKKNQITKVHYSNVKTIEINYDDTGKVASIDHGDCIESYIFNKKVSTQVSMKCGKDFSMFKTYYFKSGQWTSYDIHAYGDNEIVKFKATKHKDCSLVSEYNVESKKKKVDLSFSYNGCELAEIFDKNLNKRFRLIDGGVQSKFEMIKFSKNGERYFVKNENNTFKEQPVSDNSKEYIDDLTTAYRHFNESQKMLD